MTQILDHYISAAPLQSSSLSPATYGFNATLSAQRAAFQQNCLSELVLKVASRCNLDCDYCYMYTMADSGWKQQERIMSLVTAERIARRVADYAHAHNLHAFDIIFHGGEPLLAGAEQLSQMTELFRTHAPDVQFSFSMQTNGTLLTSAALSTLSAAHIMVGVSLDGTRAANDRHRLYSNGKSSYAAASEGLRLLADEYRQLFGGVLAVMDLAADPLETFGALNTHRPPSIDFLFPLAHHSNPPAAGYGAWLAEIFDYWSQADVAFVPDVRLFHIIIDLLLGRSTRAGFIGASPDTLSAVIQPDGSAELLDALKSTTGTATYTGLNVHSSSLDTIAAHPGYRQPVPALTCWNCDLFKVCGGGYYTHRWSQTNGFDNPSVYCDELKTLITHIQRKVQHGEAESPGDAQHFRAGHPDDRSH